MSDRAYDGKTKNDKNPLARIAVAVGILAGIATIVGVAIPLLNKESNEVVDYQNQVLATCEQIHKILTTEHNEIFVFGPLPGDAGSPADLIRIRKDLLLQVMGGNLSQARIAFDELNKQEVPAALTARHQDAVKAREDWYGSLEQFIKTVKDRLPQNAPMTKLQELGVDLAGGTQGANTRLNSAMTALAGKNCQVTG